MRKLLFSVQNPSGKVAADLSNVEAGVDFSGKTVTASQSNRKSLNKQRLTIIPAVGFKLPAHASKSLEKIKSIDTSSLDVSSAKRHMMIDSSTHSAFDSNNGSTFVRSTPKQQKHKFTVKSGRKSRSPNIVDIDSYLLLPNA